MQPALIGFHVCGFCHDEYHELPGFVMVDGSARVIFEGNLITVVNPIVNHLKNMADCRADFHKACDLAALQFGKDFDAVLKTAEELQAVRNEIERSS